MFDWTLYPRCVRAIVARGFEGIHCSSLIGMGVPCSAIPGRRQRANARARLDGAIRPDGGYGAAPTQPAILRIERRDGRRDSVPLVPRIDRPIEAAYFSAGGILPYVLEQLLAQGAHEEPIQ